MLHTYNVHLHGAIKSGETEAINDDQLCITIIIIIINIIIIIKQWRRIV